MAKKKAAAPRKRVGRARSGRGANPTAPDTLARHLSREKAYQLRLEGFTYEEIGQKLGVHRSCVFRLIVDHMAEIASRNAVLSEALRRREFAITDELLNTYVPQAVDGNADAADLVLRILARRARYGGLDSPTKVDVVGQQTMQFVGRNQIENEIRQALFKLKKG